MLTCQALSLNEELNDDSPTENFVNLLRAHPLSKHFHRMMMEVLQTSEEKLPDLLYIQRLSFCFCIIKYFADNLVVQGRRQLQNIPRERLAFLPFYLLLKVYQKLLAQQ